jgi:hypothetical protein
MSRVINPENAGKIRTQNMRTAAEILRLLSQKAELDEEAKDMVAQLVYCFREIEDGVEESMIAWEKRNYWNKVEQFRAQWVWVGLASANLQEVVRNEQWEQLPALLAGLFKHFTEINITKLTRKADAWQGAHARLKAELPPKKTP